MRQVVAAERARSANRSPVSLWVPSESFRWMTGPRSARSAGLLVGSTPSVVVNVQSAGQAHPPAAQAPRLSRARLRPALLTRLRRTHRRRLGTRPRVLTRLLLEPLQPILVLRKPAREIENELDTRHTPCVIDRLRLGAVHACKIRCTNEESLPKAPTTERLPSTARSSVVPAWDLALGRLRRPGAPSRWRRGGPFRARVRDVGSRMHVAKAQRARLERLGAALLKALRAKRISAVGAAPARR